MTEESSSMDGAGPVSASLFSNKENLNAVLATVRRASCIDDQSQDCEFNRMQESDN